MAMIQKGYTVKVKEGNELDIAYVYDRDGNLMYACNALDVDLVARVMGLL